MNSIKPILQSLPHGAMDKWWTIHAVQGAYREMADEFIASLANGPVTSFDFEDGVRRGVVTCGGGEGYYPSLWVMLHTLRQKGCMLPVEVWHLGPAEMDPFMKRLIHRSVADVTFVDAVEVAKRFSVRTLTGGLADRAFALKPYAILHSRFQEVLYLDADCTPLRDPAFLFDTPQYQRYGAVFWPDVGNTQLHPHVYELFGVKTPLIHAENEPKWDNAKRNHFIEEGQRRDPALESGQLVVDRGRCWRQLALAEHYSEHSDYWWKHVYGDKESFHMAWRRLGTEYAMPHFWPGWDGRCLLQHDFAGRHLFEHRVADKWSFDPLQNRVGLSRNSPLAVHLLHQLYWAWGGRRLWENLEPSTAEREATSGVPGTYEIDHSATVPEPTEEITLYPDYSTSRRGQYWSVWETEEGIRLSVADGQNERREPIGGSLRWLLERGKGEGQWREVGGVGCWTRRSPPKPPKRKFPPTRKMQEESAFVSEVF